MAAQQLSILIEVVKGNPKLKSVRIPPGGSIVVGRLAECDLADPSDLHLSRQHCRIEYRAPDCVLKNLSSNGTLVNGQPADEIKLHDGDRIECSQLALNVTFAMDEPPTQQIASAAVTTRRDRLGTYSTEPCRSGLVRYAGQQEHPDPAEMLARLVSWQPAYAIVDFRKIGTPVPADLTDSDPLFYWLPPESVKTGSPLIVAAADTEQFAELVQQGWGKDGIVCWFSRVDRDPFVRHLQDATGYRADAQDVGGMLGYCWPGVLNLLLAYQPPDATAALMKGIDAVLVEAPDSPAGWNLYARESFGAVLQKLGLVQAEPAPA